MEIKELYWAAGFIEGDGCFSMSDSKARRDYNVVVTGADPEPLERLAKLFGNKVLPYAPGMYGPLTKKKMYRWTATGSRAIGVMMTLYSLMSERRKTRIREVIQFWKYIPPAKKYRKARGISFNEVRKEISI